MNKSIRSTRSVRALATQFSNLKVQIKVARLIHFFRKAAIQMIVESQDAFALIIHIYSCILLHRWDTSKY